MASLVAVEQFAAYPRVVAAGVPTEGALPLLEAVSDEVRDYCGWHIAPAVTETVTVDGSGGEVLALPTLHLTRLVSVTEDGAELAVAGIEWSQAGYLRKLGGCWTSALRGVVAEIEHGYPETPPGLVALVCEVALRALTVPAGVGRESSGGESVTWTEPPTLLPREMRMLDRRYAIAGRP